MPSMPLSAFENPALTIALALAAGMLSQALARHLRMPGIVVLLAAGVLLGPDALNAVRPATLGPWLRILVGFAVAVVLFEGGMNLSLKRLRREARSIRQLITIGALVTAAGGALTVRWILGWSWTPALLFGTLVMVTGPTVITPLLRRIKVKERIATVLEAEGILVDAVGAIVAVVALEVAIRPAGPSLAAGAWHVVSRLGFGTLLGAAAGLAVAALLRSEWIPEGLENAFTISMAVAIFQGSNALLPETGIVTVVAAGLVVGNAGLLRVAELREFKEQITVLLIGLLFVLLAADVRLAQVRALGWAGLAAVLALMLVVRPLNVLAGTLGTDLTWREKAFLAWLAPRGIVAAAVSSLFAQSLAEAGIPGGEELRALVFLVIAVTVVVQGLSGGAVASRLGVRRPSGTGWVILGANDLARAVGRSLRDGGEEVIFIDSNPDSCHAAEAEGFRVLYGSGLEQRVQQRAEMDLRAGCLGLTSNEEVNLLFARRARKDFKVPRAWVAVRSGHLGIEPDMVQRLGAHILFAGPQNLTHWISRLERGEAAAEVWSNEAEAALPVADGRFLPLTVSRGRKVFPMDESLTVRRGDRITALVLETDRAAVQSALAESGWTPAGR
jgi:NhaP-type Na+/H+ or K+/H+ antiporter